MHSIGHTIWLNLVLNKYEDDRDAKYFLDELMKAYSAKNRYYHNWSHIEKMLQLYEQYSSQLQDREVVGFSIFYHDVIYKPLRKDNELLSADYAVNKLSAMGVPKTTQDQVRIFIEATYNHKIPASVSFSSDLAFFLDFDMSILGAARDEYRLYKEQVRKEYRLVPSLVYRPGRKKFLLSCLESEFIFYTPEFRSSHEARAKENIRWELETDYQ